jgi:hypothetical protein
MVSIHCAAADGHRVVSIFTYHASRRIETRRIVMKGEGLLADGKYDEAIANYRQLGKSVRPIK